MPAGDAGHEPQAGKPESFSANMEALALEAQRHWRAIKAVERERDELRAQLVAIQAQLVARGPYCALHGEHQPCSQHRWVDTSQAAQPEGERAD